MSKELTEQWRNGTLPFGLYYVKTTYGDIRTDETVYLVGKKRYRWQYTDICCLEEVISPVPTYNQFVELTEKIEELELRKEELEQQNAFECECNKEYADTLKKNEQLEKKFDIAIKALDFYKKDVCGESYISRIATETLKEIDEVL